MAQAADKVRFKRSELCFFCTKAKKNGISDTEKGDKNVTRNKWTAVKVRVSDDR